MKRLAVVFRHPARKRIRCRLSILGNSQEPVPQVDTTVESRCLTGTQSQAALRALVAAAYPGHSRLLTAN